MKIKAQTKKRRPAYITALCLASLCGLLASCKTPMPSAPPAVPSPEPSATSNRPAPAPPPLPSVPNSQNTASNGITPSYANSELEYRKDGAKHLYSKYASQVYRGMLPPNIPGVGIVDVSIDGRGNVTSIYWRRRPADESFVKITDGLIRSAAPFPVPARLGKVVYTDIWLWDKSNTFQLDTLTEGQRRQ